MRFRKPATRLRRSWFQWLSIAVVVVAAMASFGTAIALGTGQWALSQRQLVDITSIELDDSDGTPTVIVDGSTVIVDGEPTDPDDPSPPPTTLVLAEPDAANFLVVGADTNDCSGIDDPSVGDRAEIGERSDTIMIWRANPTNDQLAVLSLPRDLYVDVAGGRRARINSTFRRNDPSNLIETIDRNFGIPIDHYIQVDFCAFRELVGAVGGVTIPFAAPARDLGSGLLVTETGCVDLDADMSLAYVRSRKYQYEDPPFSDNWITDGTSDFGRISRQQDFARRIVTKIINQGLYRPSVATALIETNREYLVTDVGLTVQRMLEFGNTLRRLDPSTITTYRIESTSETTASGAQVERPRINNENMQAVLDVFRGVATLDSAPDQAMASGTTASTAPSDDAASDDDTGTATAPADTPTEMTRPDDATATTLPTVVAEENAVGIAPERDLVCD